MAIENQINNLSRMDSKRELYQRPQIEVFEIKVEKGFAASPEPLATPGNNNGTWTDNNTW